MFISKTIRISRYFKFNLRKIFIPSSNNRIGVDILPRFFRQPTELTEVMHYSSEAKSVDWGYRKDKESGLYLKSVEDINVDEINVQFGQIQMSPPFWYYNEDTYSDFIKVNMIDLANWLEANWQTGLDEPVHVPDGDENIPVEYYYTLDEENQTRTYFVSKLVQWPKNHNVIFETGWEETDSYLEPEV